VDEDGVCYVADSENDWCATYTRYIGTQSSRNINGHVLTQYQSLSRDVGLPLFGNCCCSVEVVLCWREFASVELARIPFLGRRKWKGSVQESIKRKIRSNGVCGTVQLKATSVKLPCQGNGLARNRGFLD
jgi:hypothetical protein